MGKKKKWANNIKKSYKVNGIKLTDNIMKSIKYIKPGQMTHGLIYNSDGIPEMSLVIKEENPYLNQITYNPIFEQRLVKFLLKGVFVAVHMLKVNSSDDTLYETWCNFHNSKDIYRDIELFAAQDSIKVIIVNPIGDIVKIFKEPNKYKADYKEYLDEIKQMRPWGMESYNLCKMIICNNYPSVTALWEYMSLIVQQENAFLKICREWNITFNN